MRETDVVSLVVSAAGLSLLTVGRGRLAVIFGLVKIKENIDRGTLGFLPI
jgi:predicted benzoate:H+ symporter BenE